MLVIVLQTWYVPSTHGILTRVRRRFDVLPHETTLSHHPDASFAPLLCGGAYIPMALDAGAAGWRHVLLSILWNQSTAESLSGTVSVLSFFYAENITS